MMKRNILMLLCWLTLTAVSAQEKKFSPEKFEADMEVFITREAGLSAQEAGKFFPLLREMHAKQRTIYAKQRAICNANPTDGAACTSAIKQCDKLNIELKKIEQNYHNKFLQELPAKKVYDAIRAESRFHRQAMKHWQQGKPREPKEPRDRRR